MNKSRSFDRAANYYDSTRLLLEPIAKYGLPALRRLIGPQARVLEAGCGTGRVSIPLIEGGLDLVGCDLSAPMLNRFQQKYPPARLVRADASQLPFPDSTFDAVLTVHVLHLIPAWRDVMREFKRVLVPGGLYFNVRTWDTVGVSAAEALRTFWQTWMKEHGVDAGHPGVRTHLDLLDELRSLGADVSEVEAVRYPDSIHLREELDRFASRVYSETWDLPEGIFASSMIELRAWAEREYGDLDRTIVDEVRFVIHTAKFTE